MEFLEKHWGDLASVLGFGLTIWFAWCAKTAAEQARDAADEVRNQISRFDTIAELSAAITIIEEIMRLQRTQAWEVVWDIVLDRHSVLRGYLVRSQSGIERESLRATVREAVGHFRIMVGEIEREDETGADQVGHSGVQPTPIRSDREAGKGEDRRKEGGSFAWLLKNRLTS